MDDFPNPDEEFELMYADQLELINESDYGDHMDHDPKQANPMKSAAARRSLNFNSNSCNESSHPTLFSTPTQSIVPEKISMDSNDSKKKRTVDDIFGDIDDIVAEEALEEYRKNKGHKRPRNEAIAESLTSVTDTAIVDSEAVLIDRILSMRKKASQESSEGLLSSPNSSKLSCVSKRIPKWPFMSITSDLGQRIYVRLHSEEYFDEQCSSVTCQKKSSGLLKASLTTLKTCALDILKHKQEERITAQIFDSDDAPENATDARHSENDLWVVKFRPTCYAELLSDESTNRTLLRWLRAWDKVVFNIEKKVKTAHKERKNDNRFLNKPFQQDFSLELDEFGRPFHKVVLLCGPPGLGKTTLAHIVSNLAGYNVVEVNASDDRSPEAFRTQLEAATQMKSVLGANPRPNCLVLDEIDGAPAASIETLIKFVLGKDIGRGRKKKDANPGILKRPIICVCNDGYAPALRPLRQLALVLHFPPTASERLATRLISIAHQQNINTDMGAMLALCEKTQNDIRACLSTLNYFKTQGGNIQLSDVRNSNVGLKDVQKGLFAVWQEIFQIQKAKGNHAAIQREVWGAGMDETKVSDSSLSLRIQSILRVVQNHGSYDRLAMGVFENYPNMKLKDSSLGGVVKALDWFCASDILSSEIHSSQNYILMPYLPYAFVMWHILFATYAWPKLNYPTASNEVYVKKTNVCQLVSAVRGGILPSIQVFYNSNQLVLDVLPILLDIIVPIFRPVSLQLFTSREKQEFCNLVNIMIDFNLTYNQERTQEGTYACVLDPNIEQVVLFDGCKPFRVLTYSIKQLVAREVEVEKMRRHELLFSIKPGLENHAKAKCSSSKEDHPSSKTNGTSISPPSVPNHLRKLKPKAVLKDVQSKDFFGRIVTISARSSTETGTSESDLKGDIWFHFKEGFNNAVRKTVRMSDLL